jgi:hypothetical protein
MVRRLLVIAIKALTKARSKRLIFPAITIPRIRLPGLKANAHKRHSSEPPPIAVRRRKRRTSVHLAQSAVVVFIVLVVSASVYIWHYRNWRKTKLKEKAKALKQPEYQNGYEAKSG